MKRIFFICIFAVLLLLTACSRTGVNIAIETGTSLEGATGVQVPVETAQQENSTEQPALTGSASEFWTGMSDILGDSPYYFTGYGTIEERLGADAGAKLLEGLKYSNPVTRWYSAYKIVEYLSVLDGNEVKTALEKLVGDKEDYVRNAAALSLAVINETFDAPGIYRAPSGKKAAFIRFSEARYNDGKVFLTQNGEIVKVYDDINVSGIAWSPDESKLCITKMARTWTEVSVVDLKTKNVYETGVFKFINENKSEYGYKIGENQRPDPYVWLSEWSPDSEKVLLTCYFSDDSYFRHGSLAVFNLESGKIDWFMKGVPAGEDHSPLPKPEGFNWDSPNYGIISGSLAGVAWFGNSEKLLADKIAKGYVDALNTGNAEALRGFTDPGLPGRFTEESLKTALSDYKEYFRNQKIVRTEFLYLHPYKQKTVVYRFFNGDSRFRDVDFTLTDSGKFICTDVFPYYSGYARKLMDSFITALKSGDRKAVAAVLTEDDLKYPEAQAGKVIENYKKELEPGSISFKFTGSMTGEKGDGNYIYLVSGKKDGLDISHEVQIVYGDGLVGLRDDWIPVF